MSTTAPTIVTNGDLSLFDDKLNVRVTRSGSGIILRDDSGQLVSLPEGTGINFETGTLYYLGKPAGQLKAPNFLDLPSEQVLNPDSPLLGTNAKLTLLGSTKDVAITREGSGIVVRDAQGQPLSLPSGYTVDLQTNTIYFNNKVAGQIQGPGFFRLPAESAGIPKDPSSILKPNAQLKLVGEDQPIDLAITRDGSGIVIRDTQGNVLSLPQGYSIDFKTYTIYNGTKVVGKIDGPGFLNLPVENLDLVHGTGSTTGGQSSGSNVTNGTGSTTGGQGSGSTNTTSAGTATNNSFSGTATGRQFATATLADGGARPPSPTVSDDDSVNPIQNIADPNTSIDDPNTVIENKPPDLTDPNTPIGNTPPVPDDGDDTTDDNTADDTTDDTTTDTTDDTDVDDINDQDDSDNDTSGVTGSTMGKIGAIAGAIGAASTAALNMLPNSLTHVADAAAKGWSSLTTLGKTLGVIGIVASAIGTFASGFAMGQNGFSWSGFASLAMSALSMIGSMAMVFGGIPVLGWIALAAIVLVSLIAGWLNRKKDNPEDATKGDVTKMPNTGPWYTALGKNAIPIVAGAALMGLGIDLSVTGPVSQSIPITVTQLPGARDSFQAAIDPSRRLPSNPEGLMGKTFYQESGNDGVSGMKVTWVSKDITAPGEAARYHVNMETVDYDGYMLRRVAPGEGRVKMFKKNANGAVVPTDEANEALARQNAMANTAAGGSTSARGAAAAARRGAGAQYGDQEPRR